MFLSYYFRVLYLHNIQPSCRHRQCHPNDVRCGIQRNIACLTELQPSCQKLVSFHLIFWIRFWIWIVFEPCTCFFASCFLLPKALTRVNYIWYVRKVRVAPMLISAFCVTNEVISNPSLFVSISYCFSSTVSFLLRWTCNNWLFAWGNIN